MANALYQKGKGHLLQGDIDWVANNIKCKLLKAAYVADTSKTGHEFANDAAFTGNIISTSGNLASKTQADADNGVAEAADVTFTAVGGGVDVGEFIIYVDGTAGVSDYLIAHFDTATGMPVTPNGGDITIQWSDTTDLKIFAL